MFASREEAGRRLGEYLKYEELQVDLVVGLPRGGVVVAAEVAHVLQVPLDVLMVRKIGHPLHREFAVGAIADHGIILLNERILNQNPGMRAQLDDIIHEEQKRLNEYKARFHFNGHPSWKDKSVVLVDDGLATGATTEAAVLSARKEGARKVIVAVPVASTNATDKLLQVADDVRALLIDPDFDAVGRYYDNFSQTTDEEVLDLLKAELKNRFLN